MNRGRGPTRRSLLAGSLGRTLAAWAPLAGLSGCTPGEPSRAAYDGGWIGASHERGHRLRVAGAAASAASSKATDATASPATTAPAAPRADIASTRRVGALVVGAGVAGLAAARALRAAGIDDCHVLELEDGAGGNSRGHAMAGMRCPLGAHYLPVPGPHDSDVADLLDELGLRRVEHGRAVYDERVLCHSPQERLFIGGGWRDGLLPPLEALADDERAFTLADYRAFAAAVAALPDDAFTVPTARSRWSDALSALDRVTFAAWLDGQGLRAPALRWYLDYCCRDDYGAGAAQVSAWAGLHYFASRHGFRAPDAGDDADGGSDVLTWPEGNAWLAGRLAAPLGERLHGSRVVVAIEEGRHEVVVEAWHAATGRRERWLAPQVVIATPLFVAARLLAVPPPALGEAARSMRHAPWLVANLQLDDALDDRPGAAPSWDNVVYGGAGLGYVDAMHQSTRPVAGPTVLTAYWALGGDSPEALASARRRLLDDDWRVWAARVLGELAAPHPDLAGKVRRVDLMRYGHAMSVPVPGVRSSAALAALAAPQRRVHYAHADLAGHSVFEEALFHGTRAGRAAAARRG